MNTYKNNKTPQQQYQQQLLQQKDLNMIGMGPHRNYPSSYIGDSLLSYYVPEYFPTTPDHIIAYAEALAGPVLCPALLHLTMSHPGGCNGFRVLSN